MGSPSPGEGVVHSQAAGAEEKTRNIHTHTYAHTYGTYTFNHLTDIHTLHTHTSLLTFSYCSICI